MDERGAWRRNRRRWVAALGLVAAGVAPGLGAAAIGPRRIQLVVPQPPGGAADALGRVLAEQLEKSIGATVIVINKPGANGAIANEYAARSPADGGTLMLASTATHVIGPNLIAHLPVDPVRDFDPVINVAWQTKVITVHRSLGVTTLRELVERVRANPGRYNYGSTGPASTSHVDTAVLATAYGLDLVHVPYRGSAQMVTALAIGEVQVLLASVTVSLPAIQSGQAIPLAVLSARRSPLLANVPTLDETGFPTTDLRGWIGVVAPRGTPAAFVERLNGAIARSLATPEFSGWMHEQGLEPIGGTPAEFGRRIVEDIERWGQVTRRIGLRPA